MQTCFCPVVYQLLDLFFQRKIKVYLLGDDSHPPEWATCQKSSPEKWYTTYCQGPLGVPKNVFGQI